MTALPYRHLDTATMPFTAPHAGPGERSQLLWRDPETGSTVQMIYGPAGFSARVAEVLSHGPHRHFHKTVNERHYVLAGDYPIWHWPQADGEGTLSVLRRHTYLENPPRTLHGIRPETRPEIATQLLVWNNGSGTSLFEDGADKETIEVPLDGCSMPDVEWAHPRLLSTKDLAWQPHPSMAGWKIKDVAPAAEGCPPVVLVSIPPDFRTAVEAPALPGADRRWLFVLSGDLSLVAAAAGTTARLRLQEGHFLSWTAATDFRYPAGSICEGGCVALCVGHDLARPT